MQPADPARQAEQLDWFSPQEEGEQERRLAGEAPYRESTEGTPQGSRSAAVAGFQGSQQVTRVWGMGQWGGLKEQGL